MFKPMSAKTYLSLAQATSEGIALCIFMFTWVLNICIRALIGGICVSYVVSTVGPLLVHHEAHVSKLLAGLIGLFTVSLFVPMAIITWLIVHLS